MVMFVTHRTRLNCPSARRFLIRGKGVSFWICALALDKISMVFFDPLSIKNRYLGAV